MTLTREDWLQVAEQQSLQTRSMILSMAVDLIAELGYSRFSTSLLAERASVSRGALQHHFGNRKTDLVLAVAEHVYGRFQQNADRIIPADASLETRIEKTLDSAFEIYSGPEAVVLLELWMAARSDDTLKAKLAPVMARLDDAIGSGLASRFSSTQATTERVEAVRYLARFMFRGMTLERQLWTNEGLERRVVDLMKELMIAVLVDRPIE